MAEGRKLVLSVWKEHVLLPPFWRRWWWFYTVVLVQAQPTNSIFLSSRYIHRNLVLKPIYTRHFAKLDFCLLLLYLVPSAHFPSQKFLFEGGQKLLCRISKLEGPQIINNKRIQFTSSIFSKSGACLIWPWPPSSNVRTCILWLVCDLLKLLLNYKILPVCTCTVVLLHNFTTTTGITRDWSIAAVQVVLPTVLETSSSRTG